MSKVKIQGNASGTGVLTIEAPNTNTDRTITLPDTTGTLLDTNSSLSSSKLTGALPAIDGSSLTSLTGSQVDSGQVTCKAWVNFNGTGTVAIRDSYNVSSITDNGTGDYTVNFTNAMANANYSVSGIAQSVTNSNSGSMQNVSIMATTGCITTSFIRVSTQYGNGSVRNATIMCVQVFGD